MYDENRTEELLRKSKNIAVVGISDKTERPSYDVSSYLVRHGFNVIPVNPSIDTWNGIKAYPDLLSIPSATKINIVDIFRKSEQVLPVVEEALKIHPDVIWMQEGVINIEAAELAKRNNVSVVMDRCIKKEHMRHTLK
ncbi:MAG: CoA-binding protein [Thermoplasmatales archaeon B_DKE]|nr:MAG: CoA-binding protein [Thermoplasmatales archaeon B_DKE]QRF74846.1 acetyl coenzyme A synthetase (ADP forming), alpha domain [Thermoplasmatales archaeon]